MRILVMNGTLLPGLRIFVSFLSVLYMLWCRGEYWVFCGAWLRNLKIFTAVEGFSILWHVHPLLGNDSETNNKKRPLLATTR
jgi:hypothetical protein